MTGNAALPCGPHIYYVPEKGRISDQKKGVEVEVAVATWSHGKPLGGRRKKEEGLGGQLVPLRVYRAGQDHTMEEFSSSRIKATRRTAMANISSPGRITGLLKKIANFSIPRVFSF